MVNRRTWVGSALVVAVVAFGSFRLGAQEQDQASPAAAPGAPTGLTYLVSNNNLSLFWTHATGTFTHYVIEAGLAPGETIASFSTDSLTNASLLTQRISAVSAAGIGAANYYMRVRGANGTELGPATPDLFLPITGACQPPGAPTDLTAIVRSIPAQTFAWIQWNPGSGGVPTAFTLTASETPGGPPIAGFQTPNNFLNVTPVPNGTYYVRVVAHNACGTSAPSNEVSVVAPSNNLPARTPNPVNGGRLPLPYVFDIVQGVIAENPSLLSLEKSCPGYNAANPSQTVKYERNQAIDAIVDRLRLIDTRFGYNSKPTRGPADNGGQPVEVAGDEIAYHYGSDAPEGSPNVHLVDLINSHCGGTASLGWRNFTNGEFGRWTGDGRF